MCSLSKLASPGADAAGAGSGATACPAPKPAATILVVDDEPQNCRLLQALLRPEGYIVHAADGGKQALASIAEHPPDLILLDVTMPEMDGYEVAAVLKSSVATSNIPIIMVTALIDRDARLAGLKSGAEEFLTKPVDRAELWLRVRNLLRLKAHGDFLANHGCILGRLVKSRTEDLQRFRAAMEISGDAIALVDRASLSYVDVNQTLCEMLGYARGELIGKTVMEIFSADRGTLERDYDALIADKESGANRVEGQYRRKDGSAVPVESRRRALLTDKGWVIVCNARDLTQTKAADARLREVAELRTGRKRDEEALRLFAAAMDLIPDAIYLADRATLRFEHVNAAACGMQGHTREELMALGPAAMLSMPPEELGRVYDALIASGREESVETLRPDPQGVPIWVERRRHAQRTADGWMIITQVRDITARKGADARIAHLNRVYAVLSGINSLIVRASGRDELFRDACRIAVEVGGFRMAWIGIVDSAAMTIVPAASIGMDDDILEAVQRRFSANGEPSPSTSLVAQAVVHKTAVVSNDLSRDSRAPYASRHADAGVHSMVILPLVIADRAAGVLSLYSGEREFFHEDEMKLLTELAGDIAFAIDHIEKQERLDYLAYYDVLTGLANRSLFLERVAQYLRGAEAGGEGVAVCLIDVERFKNINDSLGQAAGDLLLKQVATWLIAKTGDANQLARISADHFALVLPEVRRDGDIVQLVEKTITAFMEHAFGLEEAPYRIAAKVGIARYPADAASADGLLKNAEAALKKAKSRGERYLFYEPEMTLAVAGKLTLENRLREALDKEEFVLHYQPKINLASGKVVGAEALIRWNDPNSGLVPPGQFIPILEETGLIYDVGRWALRRAVRDYLRWRAAGLPAVRIAVNVSPLQLRHRDFVARVAGIVGLDPHAAAGLELEITESLIMQDVKQSIAMLNAVRAMGVTVAIDDFGTGFSSLSYLARLPVDTLKIDRSFVLDMTTGADGMSLVSAIIKLAHAFKLKVVAEGVETEDQSRLLRLLDCDETQGFLFCRPVPAGEFEARFLPGPAVPEPRAGEIQVN